MGAAGAPPREPGVSPSRAMGGHCGSGHLSDFGRLAPPPCSRRSRCGPDGGRVMADAAAPAAAMPTDAGALLRTKIYRRLLILAAVIGVLVSLASWGYLELIHYMQQWVYKDLPSALNLAPVPSWWPLPVLAVAAFPIVFAVAKLPGGGGHKPAEGLKAGPPTQPVELPGVLLASIASIGLGIVLGPEAPLIALGAGLAILAVKLSRKDTPIRSWA